MLGTWTCLTPVFTFQFTLTPLHGVVGSPWVTRDWSSPVSPGTGPYWTDPCWEAGRQELGKGEGRKEWEVTTAPIGTAEDWSGSLYIFSPGYFRVDTHREGWSRNNEIEMDEGQWLESELSPILKNFNHSATLLYPMSKHSRTLAIRESTESVRVRFAMPREHFIGNISRGTWFCMAGKSTVKTKNNRWILVEKPAKQGGP